MSETNNWNDEKEKKINDIKNSCNIYVIAHDKKHQEYNTLLKISTSQNIIISITIAILSLFASYLKTNNLWIIITVTILSSISTGIGIFMTFLNPETKLSNHMDIRNKYKHVIYKIEQELFVEIINRTNCNEFIKEICKEMLELETGEDSLPIINKSILNKEKKNSSIKTSLNQNTQNNKIYDIENNNININYCEKDNNNDKINGLTPEENINFYLLFKKLPSIDINLIRYQQDRLNG
jgi:ABC-type multidrug transport system fused ATPase/permease subunit